MRLEFDFTDFEEFFEAFQESEYFEEYDREFTLIAEQDGEEYYVDQYCIWCPELNATFREGLITEDDVVLGEFTAWYSGNEKDAKHFQGIYANCLADQLVEMYATQNNFDLESLKCVLEVED